MKTETTPMQSPRVLVSPAVMAAGSRAVQKQDPLAPCCSLLCRGVSRTRTQEQISGVLMPQLQGCQLASGYRKGGKRSPLDKAKVKILPPHAPRKPAGCAAPPLPLLQGCKGNQISPLPLAARPLQAGSNPAAPPPTCLQPGGGSNGYHEL